MVRVNCPKWCDGGGSCVGDFSDLKITTKSPTQGVFAEKGARFRGKWGLGAPPPPPHPRPPPPPFLWGAVGVLLKIQGGGGLPGERGGGARGVYGELGGGGGGGAEAPFTVKNEPPFRRKRLQGNRIVQGWKRPQEVWLCQALAFFGHMF